MKPLWISVLLLMLLAVGTSAPMTGRSAEAGVIAEQPPQQVPYVYGQDLSKYIYDQVAVTRIQSYVAKFTENGTRYISDASEADSGTNMYARNYLVDMFGVLSSGRIETEIVGSHRNIVSRLPGYLPGDNPVFVVSAHYDSAPASPGANCDGSGIAVLLELVDIMSDFVWPLDIYFVAFNSLFGDTQRAGSIEVAQWFMNNEIDLLTLYNVDTVLVPDTSLPSDWRIQMAWSTYAQYHE